MMNDTKFLFKRIEQEAQLHPELNAVIAGEKRYSYAELMNEVDKLGKILTLEPGNICGVLLARDIGLITTILTLLEKNLIYMPIYSSLPILRIKAMIEDSKCRVIISSHQFDLMIKELQEQVTYPIRFVYIDEISIKECCNIIKSVPSDIYDSDNPAAYIMYTSGTTGVPKGIAVSQKNTINMLNSFKSILDVCNSDIIAFSTKVCFDISILEMLLPLYCGASLLVLRDSELENPISFLQCIEKNKATILQLTPSKFKTLIAVDKAYSRLESVKQLMLGGEVLDIVCARYIREHLSCLLWNVYGPTETTVWSTYKRVTDFDDITLGSPIDNTEVFLLDKENHLISEGIGEIAIGGSGVSLGYLNTMLNEGAFIPDPHHEGRKVYKTGDLGEFNECGDLIYHGRKDNQVKIRGNRIELEEIKKVIQESGKVKDSFVCVENEKIIAFIVPQADWDSDCIRTWVKKYLPNYMTPADYFVVDSFPLNSNGKLDVKQLLNFRNALPVEMIDDKDFSDTELKLREIWSDVLDIKNIRKEDMFYELGGDSIDYMTIISVIFDQFSVDLNDIDLQNDISLKSLAELIDSKLAIGA